jgi:hydrogenase expression/formation protein HypE
MTEKIFPVGKLPVALLGRLLAQAPVTDPRVLLGPGVGLDCAVIEAGDKLLVLKSDPITFATDEIGWYAVQVNANDIATAGATPCWFIMTLLLPEGRTTAELAEGITQQVYHACKQMGVSVIGGHSEITFGLDRPILIGTLIGEVARDALVTPQGAAPGDRVLLTKGVPIEATAILARQFPERLRDVLTGTELEAAQGFLYDPGISVLRDARTAVKAGRITAMHDPTEGGLATALWELAEASGHTFIVDPDAVPIPSLSRRICAAFGMDPLASIASGALLMTARADDASGICRALEGEGIPCSQIGVVEPGPAAVWRKATGDIVANGLEPLDRPERDEIARVFGG